MCYTSASKTPVHHSDNFVPGHVRSWYDELDSEHLTVFALRLGVQGGVWRTESGSPRVGPTDKTVREGTESV